MNKTIVNSRTLEDGENCFCEVLDADYANLTEAMADIPSQLTSDLTFEFIDK